MLLGLTIIPIHFKQYSKYYKNNVSSVKFLQIWLSPNKKRDVTPRYNQVTLENEADRKNKFQQILSPIADDEGVWIYQDAWFHSGKFERGILQEYKTKKEIVLTLL
jgi:quercetin 2,3-dioxygenase